MFKIILYLIVMIAAIPLALFIGKTTVNFDTMSFHIERPITAMMFYATVLAALIEDTNE